MSFEVLYKTKKLFLRKNRSVQYEIMKSAIRSELFIYNKANAMCTRVEFICALKYLHARRYTTKKLQMNNE